MDERRDFIEILIEDHTEAEAAFAEIEEVMAMPRTAQTVAQAQELTQHVIGDLVKHSVAEEEYVYPEVRRRLPNGDDIADMEIAEHATAEETMKDLDRMTPQNVDFMSRLRTLATQIREHAGKEEADLLPALGGMMSQDERLEVGERIQRAKAMAPTHPHPLAPDRPPLNKVLGPGVALIDRVRDKLTHRKG
jgi:hemerythrin superfamily protein